MGGEKGESREQMGKYGVKGGRIEEIWGRNGEEMRDLGGKKEEMGEM